MCIKGHKRREVIDMNDELTLEEEEDVVPDFEEEDEDGLDEWGMYEDDDD